MKFWSVSGTHCDGDGARRRRFCPEGLDLEEALLTAEAVGCVEAMSGGEMLEDVAEDARDRFPKAAEEGTI